MRRIPGSHAPNIKNRSSKHLSWLTKMKPIVKSMSNEALAESKLPEAHKELNRRQKKREKKDAK